MPGAGGVPVLVLQVEGPGAAAAGSAPPAAQSRDQAAYHARPRATPGDRTADTHDRVRVDRIDDTGTVSLRMNGRLHHIGIGRTHARTHVLLLVRDLRIRVINAATGELLRELTLDPSRNYQPTGKPPGPQPGRKRRTP